jgi:hypothetical protein
MPNVRRQQKNDLLDRFVIIWSGAVSPQDGMTKGELLPRYERKGPSADTTARLVPRKHRSAE